MSLNIRSVLELLSNILLENGVACLKAETFRQSKFNEARATEAMWRALHDIIMFYDMNPSLKKDMKEASQVDTIRYVKSYLQNWGYLSRSFAELPDDMSKGSRELLLALGWLLYSKDVIGEIMSRRSSPIHKSLYSFDPSPVPMCQLPMALKTPSRALSAKQKLQRHILLSGKLKMSLRRLYSRLQEAAKLKQEIHKSTTGLSLQPDLDHLTSLEVYLLRYPSKMKNMIQQLTKDNAQLKSLLDWKEKEQIFWEWMDSVLTLHNDEVGKHHEPKSDSTTGECIFLSLPSSIADDISDTRTQLRDFILKHEEEMHKLDEMLADKKVSYQELQIATNHSEKEIAELSQTFSKHCRIGKEDKFSSKSVSHLTPKETMLNGARSHLNYSLHSLQREKKSEMLEMMEEEMKAIQQQTSELESQLKELQLSNIHKLQSIMGDVDSTICILPKYFKKFSL